MIAVGFPGYVLAQQGGVQNQSSDKDDVRVLPVQNNIYMIAGSGGNITAQVGKDGILLVDAGFAEMAPKVVAALRKLSDKSIQYIINTHVHRDHTGGNDALAKAGATIAGGNFSVDISDAGQRAAIIAHESVLDVLSAAPSGKANDLSAPSGSWPTDTFFGLQKDMFFNGEGIEMIHIPNAHTSGDSMVFFRRSDVISTGDILAINRYPMFDLEGGGSIQGVLQGLNKIIGLSIPADKEEGGTLIVPGHGRICDQADVAEYRDMTTIIRDRIQDMIKKGMTLEKVKAARPTFDYDPLYGSNTGFGSTDNFVEAVYKSLAKQK
jgi:glyoxylase-like metal-dependent hydrolase (beta-lactamase superfamily II)